MFDPITLTLGAGVIGAGANALFGKQKREWTLEDLKKYGLVPYDKDEELRKWSSEIMGKIKEQRANLTQKAEAEGISAPTSIYASESGIWDAFEKGKEQIDATDREEKNRIASTLFQLNAAEEANTPTAFQNIFGGFLSGAQIGSNIANFTEGLNAGPGKEKTIAQTFKTGTIDPSDKNFLSMWDAYKKQFGKSFEGNFQFLPTR